MQEIVLRGRKVVGGEAEGEALVTRDAISFMGGVDYLTGTVVEKGHDIEGRKISGKILVFPMGKGSTGGSYMLFDMVRRGVGPKAIINIKAEPIVAIGAILAKIPMMDKLEKNPIEVIKTGDRVSIDSNAGIVRVIRG